MGLKFKNNAATTLAALVASTDLSLTVNSTLGAVFPVLGGGDYFYCTLQSLTTPSTIEVVKVTAVAGNTFTIVRAQDGTTAQNFSVGDRVELRLVAAVLNDIPKLDETNTFQLAMTLLQSLTVGGLVTAQGGLTAQGALTAQAALTASLGVTFGDATKLSSANQLSFRNRAHNGNFTVNQRQITSPTTLAAGVTGFDRWKAGPGGCTFSFAASGNGNIITITAGTLIHVVEDLAVEGGSYVVSHQGTAQIRTGVNGAVPSGAYANATTASPLAFAAATAKQTISVEFGLGTVDRVQIEPGTAASPFERRPPGVELILCQRFYEPLVGQGSNARLFRWYGAGSAGEIRNPFPFQVQKRAIPAIVNAASDFSSNCSASIGDVTIYGYNITMLSSALGTGSFGWITTTAAASAEI